jgi:hypothetical protein
VLRRDTARRICIDIVSFVRARSRSRRELTAPSRLDLVMLAVPFVALVLVDHRAVQRALAYVFAHSAPGVRDSFATARSTHFMRRAERADHSFTMTAMKSRIMASMITAHACWLIVGLAFGSGLL